jgi:tetratricopeptide (TPR) repeat protein
VQSGDGSAPRRPRYGGGHGDRSGARRTQPPRRRGEGRPPSTTATGRGRDTARQERRERPRGQEAAGGRQFPEPPPDVDPGMLAQEVRAELRSLSKANAERVARHLVAAGRLVDEDPEAALEHARAARATAGRIGVVREAVGVAAYHAGEWAEALAEFRAARRLTGDPAYLPVIADCERALGRPERALDVARSAEVARLPDEQRVEMRIVEAGARRDMGELDAALLTLEAAGLDRSRVEPWSPRLWYAYADTLLAAGRTDEAYDWFAATVTIDEDGLTDASDRLEEWTAGGSDVVEDPDADQG